MTATAPANIVCFGEALWDVLPDSRVIGGAPLNVAYHLTRFGSRGWTMSAVGDDELGCELLAQVRDWGLPADLIATVADKDTGRSIVTLDNGSPSFDVVSDVAWDYIDPPVAWPETCQPIDALVFGSITQRSAHNRASLQELFGAAPAALKVFDANLRPTFDDLAQIWALARCADLFKLSDEEAQLLLNRPVTPDNIEARARDLQEETACERICLTAGAAGGGLLLYGDWYWVDGVPVEVRDTVGAGDSFLAALLHGLLTAPEQAAAALRTAARLASFVAGSDGATPDYDAGQFL